MATPRRGALARLYDGVISATKAVGRAFTGGARPDSEYSSAKSGLPGGEKGMARLIGPWGGGAYGAPNLTRDQQVSHFRGWVYTCVDFICTQMAREPPTAVLAADPDARRDHATRTKAYRRGAGPAPEARRWCPPKWVTKSQGPAKPHEEYEFLPDDDWLTRLLSDPNDPETGVSVWYEWQMYVELCGSSYLWAKEGDDGRPDELWVIPANWVREVCEGEERLVDYYEVSPRGGGAGLVRFAPEEIIALKRPSPLSKLYGYSPLQAAATTVDGYESTEAARIQSLRNGAAIGGTIEVDPELAAGLDDEQIARLEARFANKFAGVHNSSRPAVLAGMKWVPAPPERELAFMQSMDQLRKHVMAHWRLSEAALGFTGDTNRASMVAAIASAMYHVVNPRQKFASEILTEKLAKLRDPRCRVFWPDCTPSDPDAERQDMALMVQAKAVTTNDVRTWGGLEPLDDDAADQVPGAQPPPGAAGAGPGGQPPPGGSPPPGGGGPDAFGTQAAGMAADADMKPGKEEKAAAGLVRKAAGRDRRDEIAAHALAMVRFALESHAGGFDPTPGLEAIRDRLAGLPPMPAKAAGGMAVKGWSEDVHPRDDHGRFVSKDKLNAAKSDPKLAKELRSRVTKPEERAKLDAVLGGETDPGRTKRGEQRHQAGLHRVRKRAAVEAARAVVQAVADGTATAEQVASLADHLAHATVPHLQQFQSRLAFGHRMRRKADLIADLLKTARAATEAKPDAAPSDVADPAPAGDNGDAPIPLAGGDDDRGGGTGTADAGARGAVAQAAGGAGGEGRDLLWHDALEPAGRTTARSVPASTAEVNKRLDRFRAFFARKGNHHAADWLGKLRDHVNAVGAESALAAVGGPGDAPKGDGGGPVQYWGVGTEEANWKHMGAFMERYLARNGIIAVTADASAPDFPLVSALGAPDRYVAGQDFKPSKLHYTNKLDEAKDLPGLEASEDLGRVVGGDHPTHFTPDVVKALDEKYGPGKWIVKCYDDNAAAGWGIYFPQRAAALSQDARNMIWDAGEKLGRHGFQFARDPAGKITGLKHAGGDVYPFGSEKYEQTIDGDVRAAAESVRATPPGWCTPVLDNEQHTALPPGASFMGQPAFPAVGISDADRAAGKTWHEKNEGRVHLVTRPDGGVEVVPHSTWLKGGNLPVVFEDDDTRAMAAAAKAAIEQIPHEARKGQVYAPDVMKTADGYRVVELNAQGDHNGSGYLHDNHFTIDAYTSYLTGRVPAHVQFIRSLLTRRQRDVGQKGGAPGLVTKKRDAEGHEHADDGKFTSGGGGAAKPKPGGRGAAKPAAKDKPAAPAKPAAKPKPAPKPVAKPARTPKPAAPAANTQGGKGGAAPAAPVPQPEPPGGKPAGVKAPPAEHAKALALAREKLKTVTAPTAAEVEKARVGMAKEKVERAAGKDWRFRRTLYGNSQDRKKRRDALMAEFGDGTKCPCVYCGVYVGHGTMEQDKIYTTAEGGRYRVNNLVPSCAPCNNRRGDSAFKDAISKVTADA